MPPSCADRLVGDSNSAVGKAYSLPATVIVNFPASNSIALMMSCRTPGGANQVFQ